MLFFLISCLSFLLLSKSLSLQLLLSWANDIRLLSVLFWQELLCLFIQWLEDCRLSGSWVFRMSPKKTSVPKAENIEVVEEFSILDLPELALECILGRLSPSGLCNMAGVCSSLKDRCRSDHLWERHMKEKWGGVIGQAAFREWRSFIHSRKNSSVLDGSKSKGWVGSLSCMWPILWLRSNIYGSTKPLSSFSVDSIMSCYLSLESGKFWFPAQVYNRQDGHVGFILSCYDAELCYNSRTDTFHARYPPHGRRTTMVTEDGVKWERLREPPVNTLALELHVSDCLNDLRPGDHIEIQWRKNKEFPYGWWYGVVGHLESCDGSEQLCHCLNSDTVMLEFNQYTPGSRWRRTAINRKDHREEGNEGDGFYGGIRKLHSKDEIAMWRRLWPKETLE